MADTNFSAVMKPPPGWVTGTVLAGIGAETYYHQAPGGEQISATGGSGVPATGKDGDGVPYVSSLYVVFTQRAVGLLLSQGWTVFNITPASGRGNQGF